MYPTRYLNGKAVGLFLVLRCEVAVCEAQAAGAPREDMAACQGKVVDAAGKPLAGAAMRIYRSPPRLGLLALPSSPER